MSDRVVWVLTAWNYVVEICKSEKQAIEKVAYQQPYTIKEMGYADAVSSIRHRCFGRSRGECEMCGSDVLEKQGHLHERLWRGKGGNISLTNSIFICARCHKYSHRSREIGRKS